MAERGAEAAAGPAGDTGFVREKRQVVKPSQEPGDIYVTRNSSFQGQKQKCLSLLAKGQNEIHLHAIGPAIVRAINLALTLVEESVGTLATSPTTSTVQLVDELTPLDDEGIPRSEVRANSAIAIRVYKLDAETYVQRRSRSKTEATADTETGDDASASDKPGKSKKKKRNRSAAPVAGQTQAGAAGGGDDGERKRKSVDMQRARAVAEESRKASAAVESKPTH